jgi:hypothetical protein
VPPKAIKSSFFRHFSTLFQVCEKLCSAFASLEASLKTLQAVRGTKPIAHFVATLIALFSLAWVGNMFNNFFLVSEY